MIRTAVLMTLLVAACDVGSVITNHQGGPDSGNGVTDTGGGGSGDAAGSNCEAVMAPNGDGHHNAGMSCIAAGCHLTGNLGALAPAFSYAGTLWHDVAKTSPYSGATVVITQGAVTKKLVTGSNGNFYLTTVLLPSPTAAMTAMAKASACPLTTPMTGTLIGGGGNCNSCHATGGTTTPINLQ